jgi:hypothetical protein
MKLEIEQIESVLKGQALELSEVKDEQTAIHLLGVLHWARNDVLFGLGDWMAHCAETFGKEWVNKQLEFSDFTFEEASKAHEVATKFPREKRHRGLSFDHHAVASRADHPELALDWALEQGLTPSELAHSVRVKVQLTKAEIKDQRERLAVISPVSIAERFTKWLGRVPQDRWTREDKQQILTDFEPVMKFLSELKRDISTA